MRACNDATKQLTSQPTIRAYETTSILTYAHTRTRAHLFTQTCMYLTCAPCTGKDTCIDKPHSVNRLCDACSCIWFVLHVRGCCQDHSLIRAPVSNLCCMIVMQYPKGPSTYTSYTWPLKYSYMQPMETFKAKVLPTEMRGPSASCM